MSLKILLFLPLLFVFFPGTASAQLCNSPIEISAGPDEYKKVGDVVVHTYTRYDEHIAVFYYSNIFNKTTETSCHELAFRFGFSVKGKKIIAPESVTLIFFSTSNALKFESYESRALKIVADEKTVFTDTPYSSSRTFAKNKSYAEVMTSTVDFPAFEKMAQAKAVSMSLGAIKIDFTANQLEAIKQMYSLIEK